MSRTLAALLLLFALVAPPPALSQQKPRQDEEVVRVGSNEVKLDVVVRDKKGHAVKDLKASEIEVFEDGVAQRVDSFSLVARGGTTTTTTTAAGGKDAAAPTATQPAPAAPVGIDRVGAVAFVFDRLSADGRARARQAALGFLAGGLAPEDFVGVFRVDLSLRVVQPFTNSEPLVRAAVDRAATIAGSGSDRRAGQIADAAQAQSQLQAQGAATQAGAGGAATDTGAVAGAMMSNAVAQTFADVTRRSLETFEMLERTQEGYATTNSLLAVIDSLKTLPGRKILLLFSEGISIPSAVEAHFRSVISNANRAGVSIYAVNAAGLKVTSEDAEIGRAMTALGQQRLRDAGSRDDPGRPMTRDLERNEDLIRYNPNTGLGQLAEQTGGFLVKDTNNPGARLRQADEDLHTYYALAYTPKNQDYDGRFRQITVKVTRPGVEVQARKGYYAINAEFASPVLAYEAPALAILAGGRDPGSFPVRAAAYSFPEPSRPGRVPVVVEVPGGSINFSVDAEKKTYQTDFSVVALVKDESQRVVSKLSNQYKLSGPLDQLEAARRGGFLFYREAELGPGRYTVAAAAYDATTGRAGVTTAIVSVPAPSVPGPRLASVVLVKRAERLSAADQQQNASPFRFGELLLYPNLGEPVRKSAAKELVLLLTVYPSAGSQAPPRLTVEIAQGPRSLGKFPVELPAPDATGRIQHASTIPLEKLQPGDYDLRLTAADAAGQATRTERFTIQQ